MSDRSRSKALGTKAQQKQVNVKSTVKSTVESLKKKLVKKPYSGADYFEFRGVAFEKFQEYIDCMLKLKNSSDRAAIINSLNKFNFSENSFTEEIYKLRHANFVVNFIEAYNKKI